MGPVDFVVIAVIIVIVGMAAFYVYKAKKSGRKCIGCPDGASCASSGCAGNCGGCSCGCKAAEE